MKPILYGECYFDDKEKQAVMNVLNHGWLSGGEQTAAFEKEFAEWHGVKYALAVNSGSCANFIALQALNLPKKSEIITCAMAFPTTVSPIYYHGFTPVYVDIESSCTYVIDIGEIEKAISPTTKAIMFAHTLGNVCDMDYLMNVVKKNNLYLIEDCCDAVGSKWNGKLAGTFGDLATASFYPSHHMTTGGEGGMILTNNLSLYNQCKSIRDWGRVCHCRWNEKNPNGACNARFFNKPFDHRYYYINLGLNMKMTEMQAAFGRVQLTRLDGFIERRKHNFKLLSDVLSEDVAMKLHLPMPAATFIPEKKKLEPGDCSKPLDYWERKDERIFADPSWFAFPLNFEGHNREEIIIALEKRGIQTRTMFAGNLVKHPAYCNLPYKQVNNLVNSETALNSCFFVGIGPQITDKQIRYMGKQILEVHKETE